jgi:hypothetical protein
VEAERVDAVIGEDRVGAAGFTSRSHLVLGTVLVVRLLVAEDEPRLAALLRRGFQEEATRST